MTDKTPAQRKAEQRQKWKAEGWTTITARVAQEHAKAALDYINELPPPVQSKNENQELLPFGEDSK